MKYIFLLILFTFTISLFSQEITVKSFMEKTSDLSASTNIRLDNNGKPCAMVKVQLANNGASFDEKQIVGDVQYSKSEYIIYMPEGSKRIQIKLEGFLPLEVVFSDYSIKTLESKKTYVLIIPIKEKEIVTNSNSKNTPNNTNKSSHTNTIFSTSSNSFSNSIQHFTAKGVSFSMIKVYGGRFSMGATNEQTTDALATEKPVHRVSVETFYIAETEVTQELWKVIMGSNPSNFKGDSLPVDNVSWNDCQTFITRLNCITGKRFRLPTEAEWEYAARGGNKASGRKYSGSNSAEYVGWIKTNANGSTHPVKTKNPNELGIYDMTGNVCEWCQDWYSSYSSNVQSNPKDPGSGTARIGRGGGWCNSAKYNRVSHRNSGTPSYHDYNLGFRLAL